MAVRVHFATTADGVRIAHTAEGQGEPLLFVRGWITHLEYNLADPAFAAFIGRLTRHLRVIRYDGRGNGLSDRDVGDRVGLDAFVADLEAVMDAEQVETATLWGSSWGGPIAAAYAARHPERVSRLVLDGTFGNGDELAPPEQRAEFLSLLQLARRQPDAIFAALSYMTDPEPGGSHDRRIERLRRSIDPNGLVSLYSTLYEIDVRSELGSITAPTLVLHRLGSRAVPADLGRRLASMIPGARFVALEGRAHNLWEEHADEALAVLGEFLGLDDLVPPEPTPAPPPAPPVTIMFTDIVGSTELTQRLGDERSRPVLRVHDLVVRKALAQFHGTEIKHTGDGLMASFGSVAQALAAAVVIQTELSEQEAATPGSAPAVRVGLSVGEPMSEDDDLHGLVVTLAARACDVAGAGQIAVTTAVRDMATGKGFRFRELGERDLKGFDEPVRLWEVEWRPIETHPPRQPR